MRKFLLILLLAMPGCGPATDSDQVLNDESVSHDTRVGSDQRSSKAGNGSSNSKPGLVEQLYGDIKLRQWNSLTGENIRKILSDEVIRELLGGGEGEITSKKMDYTDGVSFTTRMDGHRTGRISVEIMTKDASESTMQMHVGIVRNMIEHGPTHGTVTFEAVDLDRWGIAAFWKFEKRTSHLNIYTRHKMMTIGTEKMLGSEFKDRARKKAVAISIADRLFEKLDGDE